MLVVLAVTLLAASLMFDALGLILHEPAFSLMGLRDVQGGVVVLAVTGVFMLAALARPPRTPREDTLSLARAGLWYVALALAAGALALRGTEAPPDAGALVLTSLALTCSAIAGWMGWVDLMSPRP